MRVNFSKYTAQNFDVIRGMNPLVQPIFNEFLCRAALSQLPLYLRVTSGKRTPAEQHEEYLKGRWWLKGGSREKIVTSVLCPNSWHCHGLAVDIAPLTRASTIIYATWYRVTPFAALEAIAKALGIDHPWGNTDAPHFHYSGGLTLEQVIAGAPLPQPTYTPCEKPREMRSALKRLGVSLP